MINDIYRTDLPSLNDSQEHDSNRRSSNVKTSPTRPSISTSRQDMITESQSRAVSTSSLQHLESAQTQPDSPGLSRAKQELALEQVIKAGYLKKKGEQRRSWKMRWFVLRPTRLAYYHSDKEYELLQMIDLASIHAIGEVERNKKEFVFGIVTRARTFYMQAESREDMESWLIATTNQIKEINKNSKNPLFSPSRAIDAPIDWKSPNSSPPRLSLAGSVTSPTKSFNGAESSIGMSGPDTPVISSSRYLSAENDLERQLEQIQQSRERDPSPGPISVATTVSLLTIGSNLSAAANSLPGHPNATPRPSDALGHIIHEEPSSIDSSPHLDDPLLLPCKPEQSNQDKNPSEKSSPQRASVSDTTHRFPFQHSTSVSMPNGAPRESQFSDSEDEEEKNHTHVSPEQLQALATAEQSIVNDQIVMQGYLYKLRSSGFGKTWKKRWYVLRNGRLTCYKNDSEYEVLHILALTGVLDILDVDSVDLKNHPHCFRIVLAKKSWTFACDDLQYMNQWIGALNQVHSQVKGALRL